jgi:hypothetical protein
MGTFEREKALLVVPEGTPRPRAEALRRAARRLRDAGLLCLGVGERKREQKDHGFGYFTDRETKKRLRGHYVTTFERTYRPMTCWRSRLGQRVVTCLGDGLATGRVVRWQKHLAGLGRELQSPLVDLVEQFGEQVASKQILVTMNEFCPPSPIFDVGRAANREWQERQEKRAAAIITNAKIAGALLEKLREAIKAALRLSWLWGGVDEASRVASGETDRPPPYP